MHQCVTRWEKHKALHTYMSVFPEFVTCCGGQLGLGGCSDVWRAAAAAAAVWPERLIMVVESRGAGIEPEVLQ